MICDEYRLNQKLANRMNVSAVRAYPGLELENDGPECMEIVPVEDFAGLDEPEGGFCGRLYAPAGIGGAE